MKKTTTARLGVAVLGLTLLAAACGSSKKAAPAATTAAPAGATTVAGGAGVKCSGIKFAFIGALSGDNGNLGKNMVNGAMIAINEFNKANPGCQITLDQKDSQGDPKAAAPLGDAVAQDKSIVALIGPGFSGETKAVMPTIEAAGLAMITPGATNAKLQTNGWKSFHRILANDDKQAPGVAKLIKSKGAKVIGVVDDQSVYGKGLADTVRKELGTVAVNDSVAKGTDDYSATVTKLKTANVDYVFYGGYYADAAKLVKQLRAAGSKAVFVSGDGSLDDGFVKGAGPDAEGALLTATGAPSNVNAEFATKFKAAYGTDPALYSPEAYDCAKVFLDAVSAGKVTRADILAFTSAYDKPGVTKQIKFDATGEVAGDAVYVYEVKGGVITGLGLIK